MKKEFAGKVIAISGGTGFLGRHLIKKLIQFNPKAIRAFSRTGEKVAKATREFKDYAHIVGFFQADVTDLERMKMALDGVDILIHAAAEKRIDVCENNPMATVDINTIGTKTICMAARDQKVKKVLFISTDKACMPITQYGYSKACAEQMVIRFDKNSADTAFSSVRYGNVWGSTGSVIEKWDEAIKKNEVLEITDPDATRFFMSVGQAVDLVFESIVKMNGGELFIKNDMKAIRIGKLLSGRYAKSDVVVIGLRGTEKTHESLTETYHSNEHLVSYKELIKELAL